MKSSLEKGTKFDYSQEVWVWVPALCFFTHVTLTGILTNFIMS